MNLPASAPALAATAAVAFTAGLGAYTFRHAEGASYFSEDPAACVNCHVMREQYEAWRHSSHRTRAACNDCHTPHDPLGKWTTKALNGWNHSVKFTTGDFPEPIAITPRNRRIALAACVDCHAGVVAEMAAAAGAAAGGEPGRLAPAHDPAADCVRCHGNPGHRTRE